jgi:iron(III) transport system ATP-binding protein
VTQSASLEIERIRQTIGGSTVLDDVSLSVRPGEIMCLLGHSGCGKTTMLRVVAGLERPVAGRVLLAGREVSGPGAFVPPEARGVGLMFQDYALFPHLTILDNVAFGLSKKPAAEARRIAMQALERVELAGYAKDYPHMLSGGEQQRVALARALAPQPGIMLMDEPFSNLDQRTRESIREETVAVLRDNRSTALVVTHDAVEAMTIADRIALMRSGRIVQIGTAEELYRRPDTLFVARYFCDLNEIDGEVRDNVVTCAAGRFVMQRPMADGPCLVCIRPQSITLVIEGVQPFGGTILTRRFLGDADMVTIGIEGLPKPLHARLPAGYAAAPGERVGLRIDPGGVLAFPKIVDMSRALKSG